MRHDVLSQGTASKKRVPRGGGLPGYRLVIAWLLLQIGDTLAPALHLPDWINSALAFFLILGFPVALFLAWAYELTPDGLKRDHEVEQDASIRHLTGRKLDFTIILALALALAYFAFDKFVLGSRPTAAIVSNESGEADSSSSPVPAKAAQNTIAVLPFINISSDPEQEYFSDGLSEELLNLLARIPELQVTSRSSAFAFKGKEINIPEVASALGVAHVLEGSVRKSGNRIRITAQLIDAERDVHLWSQTYDRTLDDVFQVQDEISEAIIDALKITLLGEAPKARQLDPEALDLNLQANFFWERRAPGDVERAREYFERSLELDPNNAPAWAGLSVVYMVQGQAGDIPAEEAKRLFIESAENAVKSDPNYPEGHVRMAWALSWQGDQEGARRERELAYQLGPDNGLVIFDRANQLRVAGKLEESLPLYEKTVETDPLSAISLGNLASFYLQAGRLDDAETMAFRALEISPDLLSTHDMLVQLRILQNRFDEALERLEYIAVKNRHHSFTAIIQFDKGDREQSDAAFSLIGPEQGSRFPPENYRMQVHAYRGELEPAFDYMEQGLKAGAPIIRFLYDPFLTNMHDDPRWMRLLREAGYDPDA